MDMRTFGTVFVLTGIKIIVLIKYFAPILFFVSPLLWAQDSAVEDSTSVQYYIIDGDSIAVDAVELEEVKLLGRLHFNGDDERRRYLILRRKTRKVWPFAKLAGERLMQLNARLDSMESKRDKKKYTKIIQRYVEDEFGPKLKKLTRTEGQILVKLVYRQTATTTFDLVKEYRSGWKAFWLNTTAGLFDISMKEGYDPETVEEDYLIEDILQRSFQSNVLESAPPEIEFDYYKAAAKWNKPKPSQGIGNAPEKS